jgi:hypothetical protein
MTKSTKRAYRSPSLISYGSITELTQTGGSGGDGTTTGTGGGLIGGLFGGGGLIGGTVTIG